MVMDELEIGVMYHIFKCGSRIYHGLIPGPWSHSLMDRSLACKRYLFRQLRRGAGWVVLAKREH